MYNKDLELNCYRIKAYSELFSEGLLWKTVGGFYLIRFKL